MQGEGTSRGPRPPERELVPLGQQATLRTQVHDYPHPLARWHRHPELEIHMIRASSGAAHIGGAVRGFQPGSLYLVGSNVPHNWVSAVPAEETVPDRDILVHLAPGPWHRMVADMAELRPLGVLFEESAHGLEFFGSVRERAEQLLVSAQGTEGPVTFSLVLQLLVALAGAPSRERRVIDPGHFSEPLPEADSIAFDQALDYLHQHLGEPIRLHDVGQHLALSTSQVSRLFARATAHGFSRTLIHLRVTEACRLLRETERPVGQICWDVGFTNLSNFNRRFREVTSMTPREYRRSVQA